MSKNKNAGTFTGRWVATAMVSETMNGPKVGKGVATKAAPPGKQSKQAAAAESNPKLPRVTEANGEISCSVEETKTIRALDCLAWYS